MACRKLFVVLMFLPLMGLGCSHHHQMGHHGRGGAQYAISQAQGEMKALIARTVNDPSKAHEVEKVMEAITQEVGKVGTLQREGHKQLYALNAQYDATPEEFLKVLDKMNNRRLRAGAKILSLRFKMKELMSEQEWKELTDGMKEMRSRYRSHAEGSQKPSGPSY